MKRFLLTVSLAAMTGCSLIQAQQAVHDREIMHAAADSCRAQNAAEHWSHVQLSQCLSATEDVYGDSHPANRDLVSLFQAQRMIIAGRLDRGEIPLDQANLQLAEARSSFAAEAARRNNEAGMVQAASTSAAAQMGAASTYQIYTGLRLMNGRGY